MTHENTHNKAHSKTAIVPSKPKKGLKNLLKKAFVPMLFLGIMAMAVLSQPQPQKDDQKVPPQKKPVEEIRPSGTSDIPHETPAKIDIADIPAVQKCTPQRPSWTIKYIIAATVITTIVVLCVAVRNWKVTSIKKVDTWISAAKKGDFAYLKSQSDKMDIEAKNKDGDTALILSAKHGHLDCLKYLHKQGADIDAKNKYGYTALILSARHGYLEIVEHLVKKGANIEAENDYGETALILSAGRGHFKIVRYLCTQGADIDAKNKDGDTALIISAGRGHFKIVKHLVEKKAKIEAKDKWGNTALIWSARNNHLRCVKYLHQQGARNRRRLKKAPEGMECK